MISWKACSLCFKRRLGSSGPEKRFMKIMEVRSVPYDKTVLYNTWQYIPLHNMNNSEKKINVKKRFGWEGFLTRSKDLRKSVRTEHLT